MPDHDVLIEPPAICIRETGAAKGRGAFARRAFARGETVETCPVILFRGKTSAVPGEIRRLLFNWGALASTVETHCLVLGFGSLYNHDNPAAMRYVADTERGVMHFIAVRDIGEGEELTINYNATAGGPESDEDCWFDHMGVERLTA
jgi:uncharacterized protein